MSDIPLSVLDLVPIAAGSGPAQALANSLDLARRAEALGYRRYWFAEHHLNPGVAGTAPAFYIAQAAAATSSIRVGSAGVQMGHRTALSVVEEFGLLDTLFPGRIDLGMGRSAGRARPEPPVAGRSKEAAAEDRTASGRRGSGGQRPKPPSATRTSTEVVDGLRLPPRFAVEGLIGSERFTTQTSLLQQPQAVAADYGDQVRDLLGLLDGTYRGQDGRPVAVVPGQGADVEIWVLGSSAGDSATAAGQLGLRFAANYHVSPASVLEAVESYRERFCPSAQLARPYLCVSADAVVAEDDATARRLASGFGLWVRSIRTGQGAIAYPSPEEAAAHRWSEEDRALVADRVETQFVGSPVTVAEGLATLVRVTGADELVVTTITHDHTDRVRSYELLARAWAAA